MQTATRIRKHNPFSSGGPATVNKLFTTDYESACEAVRAAEEEYVREYNNNHPIHYCRALLALNEARIRRAKAALVEVQSRSYDVRRMSFDNDSVTVLRAQEALAQIHEEWLPDHDVAVDDEALRADLPVYTFSASYQAIL